MEVRQDVYTRITSQIVSSLERGIRPWLKPWNAEHTAGRITRPLRFNQEPYSGINVLALWASALAQNFSAPIWMTFRQAQELGGHVRKGEKGSLVVYANTVTRKETDDEGAEVERQIPFLKGYTVFNVEQIEELPERYYSTVPQTLDPVSRIQAAEEFVARTGAVVKNGGNRACYSHPQDVVQMPPFESFRDAEGYYSTLLHELTHWSGAASRLNRDFAGKRYGSEGYAVEELVAELGAAFLSADLAINLEGREDHAAYIGSWLQVLKNDSRVVFTAAAHAERAATFLHSFQKKPEEAAA